MITSDFERTASPRAVAVNQTFLQYPLSEQDRVRWCEEVCETPGDF